MKRCYRCATAWVSSLREPAVKEVCPQCNAFLHCCRNCRFHHPGLHNQCEIPETGWVGDRTGCNFCDAFEFKDADAADAERVRREQARAALGDVLGGPEPTAETALRDSLLKDLPAPKDARSRLDELFGGE